MLSYLLYHQSCSVTGRALRDALGIRFRGSKPRRDRGIYDIVLRWGSSLEFPARAELNNAEGIRRAANKWSTLVALKEAGLPTVPFERTIGGLSDYDVVYARGNYGSGGKNLVVCYRGDNNIPPPADFYTGGVDVHREYRVHVVGGDVIRIQGKYLEIPEDDRANGRVCNHANGYRFKTPQKRLNQNRLDDCVAAVKALGLDFGAVDLLLGTDRNHYILEVNTGPACSPKTLAAYVDAFTPLIRERVNG